MPDPRWDEATVELAWRDEHGSPDRTCAPSHRLLAAAVDAWEATKP